MQPFELYTLVLGAASAAAAATAAVMIVVLAPAAGRACSCHSRESHPLKRPKARPPKGYLLLGMQAQSAS